MTGKESHYIYQAVYEHLHISGNGFFTQKCQNFFEENYGFRKCLLTTSCTDALEMTAILMDLQPGDEVIVPAYTFVSTANAFVLRGAKIVFADSNALEPNVDADKIEKLITPRTKAVVVVHYAGVACEMDKICDMCRRHGLFLVEDAAQAIDAYHKGKALGSFGHFAAFSFHETKNIIAGEGGMLVVNDEKYVKRAEIIWEKGTNRSAFFRGEVDKYGWVDVGSSFLPSDMIAAFLFAQLEELNDIQNRRKYIWERYANLLQNLPEMCGISLPYVPEYASNNGHMFYLVCRDLSQRTALLAYLKEAGIHAVFHYLSLHKSPFYASKHDGRELPNCDRYADCLLRLPFFYALSDDEIDFIANALTVFGMHGEPDRRNFKF
jgi:dTDP-4-amino-4,6-dideoxygalactose transaminase